MRDEAADPHTRLLQVVLGISVALANLVAMLGVFGEVAGSIFGPADRAQVLVHLVTPALTLVALGIGVISNQRGRRASAVTLVVAGLAGSAATCIGSDWAWRGAAALPEIVAPLLLVVFATIAALAPGRTT